MGCLEACPEACPEDAIRLKNSDTKSLFTIIELNAIKKGFKEVLIY